MSSIVLGGSSVVWIATIVILVILTIVAIVFAVLGWDESQPNRPYQNISRNNVVANGNTDIFGNLNVSGTTALNQVSIESMNDSGLQLITVTGPINLSVYYSNYRIDTSGSNTINLNLPTVMSSPGKRYLIMTSIFGADNTIKINVQPGDLGATQSGATGTNPVYIMPAVPGNPDAVMIVNDHYNCWHFIAHTL